MASEKKLVSAVDKAQERTQAAIERRKKEKK